jgi:hypothetical protein
MPATLQQQADGLETRLATISGLRVFDHVPDNWATPCAFVVPDTVEYWNAFAGGDATHNWTATVVVGRQSDRSSQRQLLEYMSYSGTKSIRAAIEGDRTLGGVVQSLLVDRADNVRMVSQGDQAYLAVDFAVRIHA